MKYKVWHIERKEWIHDTWDIFIDPDGDVWEIEERGSYDRYMSKTWINEKVKVVYATGLQDKNQKSIDVGDIYRWEGYEVRDGKQIRPERIGVVPSEIYELFKLKNIIEGNGTLEIIGNIHENPELIKED